MARISLEILELTSLLQAIKTEETSISLALKKARKLNNVEDLVSLSCSYADLQSARRKLEEGLASDTKSNPLSNTK